jgi:hypothetical protein
MLARLLKCVMWNIRVTPGRLYSLPRRRGQDRVNGEPFCIRDGHWLRFRAYYKPERMKSEGIHGNALPKDVESPVLCGHEERVRRIFEYFYSNTNP